MKGDIAGREIKKKKKKHHETRGSPRDDWLGLPSSTQRLASIQQTTPGEAEAGNRISQLSCELPTDELLLLSPTDTFTSWDEQ